MPKKTKEKPAFLGLSVPQEVFEAAQEKRAKTGVPVSTELTPVLEAHYGIKRKLQDKQLAGKLRK